MTEHQDTPRLHLHDPGFNQLPQNVSQKFFRELPWQNEMKQKMINCLPFKVASEAIWSRPSRKSYGQSHIFPRWDMLHPRWDMLDPC